MAYPGAWAVTKKDRLNEDASSREIVCCACTSSNSHQPMFEGYCRYSSAAASLSRYLAQIICSDLTPR